MPENWSAIAAKVAAALGVVGFTATITRPSAETDEPQNPWDPAASPVNDPTTYTVTVMDDGIKDRYVDGLVTRRVRVLTIAAGAVVPVKADTITVRGQVYVIQAVAALAPGGVDLMYEIEVAA